jgi:hypothetical protein
MNKVKNKRHEQGGTPNCIYSDSNIANTQAAEPEVLNTANNKARHLSSNLST